MTAILLYLQFAHTVLHNTDLITNTQTELAAPYLLYHKYFNFSTEF